MRRGILILGGLFVLFGLCACSAERRYNDGLCSVGGEELNEPLDYWIHDFKRSSQPPDLFVHDTQIVPPNPADGFMHEGRGNAVASRALLSGVCDLGALSRPMTDAEVDGFVRTYGAPPIAIPVAVEALAILVPEASPLEAISSEQIRKLYVEAPHILAEVFPELKNDPEWELRDLSVHGVNSASDRYRWFREAALGGAEVSDRVREESGPLALVDAVARSRHGFGYARPAEIANGARALPLLAADGRTRIALDEAALASGAYPLSRHYYLYLPPAGARQVRPEVFAFLRFILTPERQSGLGALGLYPLAESARKKSQAAVEAAANAAPAPR